VLRHVQHENDFLAIRISLWQCVKPVGTPSAGTRINGSLQREVFEMANKPEKVFRIGNVSASVFARMIEQDGSKRTLRSVSLQKRYKDGDEVKYTTSFDLSELPQIIRVTQLAQGYVESQEAEVQLSS
jgi:hypothetical protein